MSAAALRESDELLSNLEGSVKRGWARLKGGLPSIANGVDQREHAREGGGGGGGGGNGGGRSMATVISNTIHLARMVHGADDHLGAPTDTKTGDETNDTAVVEDAAAATGAGGDDADAGAGAGGGLLSSVDFSFVMDYAIPLATCLEAGTGTGTGADSAEWGWVMRTLSSLAGINDSSSSQGGAGASGSGGGGDGDDQTTYTGAYTILRLAKQQAAQVQAQTQAQTLSQTRSSEQGACVVRLFAALERILPTTGDKAAPARPGTQAGAGAVAEDSSDAGDANGSGVRSLARLRAWCKLAIVCIGKRFHAWHPLLKRAPCFEAITLFSCPLTPSLPPSPSYQMPTLWATPWKCMPTLTPSVMSPTRASTMPFATFYRSSRAPWPFDLLSSLAGRTRWRFSTPGWTRRCTRVWPETTAPRRPCSMHSLAKVSLSIL